MNQKESNSSLENADNSRISRQQHKTSKNYKVVLIELKENRVTGTINNYRFFAIVYDIGLKRGIYGGRVLKLIMWDDYDGLVMEYDRGWNVAPINNDVDDAMLVLVHFFDAGPNFLGLSKLQGELISIRKHYE